METSENRQVSQTMSHVSPMENHIIHRLLMATNQLQSLPDMAIVVSLVFNSLLVALMWLNRHDLPTTIVAASACLLTSLLDWNLLRALPRAQRSYGPDKPPLLVLSALRAVILILMGVLPLPGWLAWVIAGLISTAAYYSTWIEPFRLGITRQRYTTDQWDPNAPPLRLLHIGDIHIERITRRERQLNRLIQELRPDVIVFSGDFVNISYTHDPRAEADVRRVISEWSAPLGVYCVPGTYTVEPMERVLAFTKDLENLQLMTNSWHTIPTPAGTLNILGMVTTHYLDEDRATLQKMMQLAPKTGLKLLLTHAPDIAPEADASGIDLYVCGHTHGGQLRLPIIGAIFSGSHLGKRFVMGRYELNHMTLYTSRGVGLEGMGAPRARFLCPPEIILWEIGGKA